MTKIKYVMTCGACPEQYDAFYEDICIGYLRLRHGRFICEYLPTGATVYSAYTDGDGIFEDYEREKYLEYAALALIAAHTPKEASKELHYTIEGESVKEWWGIDE
jgi:hypothetical protein